MPTRLPGRRAVGRGGNLKPREKAQIEEWFIEGLSALEVYAQCLDNGIEPPVEQALYRILNSDAVQEGLRERKAIEAKHRIARVAARTAERQEILNRLKITVKERADEYAGFVAGGASGLIVLSDKKTIRTSETDYDTVDIYKTDGVVIEQWRGVLSDQEKADAALRRNLREERDRTRVDERHDQDADLRDLERQKLELEVERLRAEVEALRKAGGENYQPPTFPAVVVSQLPAPERASVAVEDDEEDEGTDPEPPVIPESE